MDSLILRTLEKTVLFKAITKTLNRRVILLREMVTIASKTARYGSLSETEVFVEVDSEVKQLQAKLALVKESMTSPGMDVVSIDDLPIAVKNEIDADSIEIVVEMAGLTKANVDTNDNQT